jgi:hypothetical protein
MKRNAALAALLFLIASHACYAASIQAGAAMVWNPVAFHDPPLGGGASLAVLISQPNHFGFGLFPMLAFAPSGAVLDIMVGLNYGIAINDKLTVIPCVGLYLGMIFFGFGGNVTVEYTPLPRLCLFARVQYARATFLAPSVDSVTTNVVSPSVGVGWKLW